MKLETLEISFTEKVKEAHKAAVLSYIENIASKGLPPVLSVEHFSMLIGVRAESLYEMSNGPQHFYRSFDLPKKSGGTRRIDAPLPSLHFVQRWILDNMLSNVALHGAAKAYRKGVGIKENARFHRSQQLLLKMDVKNFFGSITERQVVSIFLKLGYSKKVSTFLAKLCCLNGSLPQGAATSGYLSNIYLTHFDEVVFAKCKAEKIRYTRYADDMTFSGPDFNVENYLKLVSKELGKLKLSLNPKKTRVLKPNNQQIVTGLVVNEKVSVPREYLRSLKQDCYFIHKFGIYGHCRQIENANPRSTLEQVIGRLSYVSNILSKDKRWADLHGSMMAHRKETFGY
jgi:RNA-directed DNA polymerase